MTSSKSNNSAARKRQQPINKQRINEAYSVSRPGRGLGEEARRQAVIAEKKARGVQRGLMKKKAQVAEKKRMNEGMGWSAALGNSSNNYDDEGVAAVPFFSVGADDAGEGWGEGTLENGEQREEREEEEESGEAVGGEKMMQEAPEPVTADELNDEI
ncbi:MAG: hypothetical protein M1835_005948 [Candelina submexicana]|nr:MAG: hypothetical protein M1835_005948 [Candelina submexicana]